MQIELGVKMIASQLMDFPSRYLGYNLISWFTRKQNTVTRSSIKSEYRVLANTTRSNMVMFAAL